MLHDVHERHILSAMLWLLWVLLHLCLCVVAHLMHPDFICKVDRMLHIPVWHASKVRHALCWAQGSTARGDPRIRKVEEDIDGVKQAQPLLPKQKEELVEELKQLREKELLLLRQLYKQEE